MESDLPPFEFFVWVVPLVLLTALGAWRCAARKNRTLLPWGLLVAIFWPLFLVILLLPTVQKASKNTSPISLECEACKGVVSTEATVCPHCGHPQKAAIRRRKRGVVERLGILSFILLVILVPLSLVYEGQTSLPPPVSEKLPPGTVDIIDFLVDQRDYIGKVVTVRGCHFGFADVQTVGCLGIKDGSVIGTILLDSQTVERSSLRRMIQNCLKLKLDPDPPCMGDVTGTVYDMMAQLRVPNYPVLGMKNVTVTWAVP